MPNTLTTATAEKQKRRMNVKENGRSQASEIKANFNHLSAHGLLLFAEWYNKKHSLIAEEFAKGSHLGNPALNEFALWLYMEYPERVMFLERQARADQLFDSINWAELEDLECDPRAGCNPVISKAIVHDNGELRDMTSEELDEVNELCDDAIHEWFIERYA